LDNLSIVLATVNLDLGFDVALQRSVVEASILWIWFEEDLVCGSVCKGDLHVRKNILLDDFILEPFQLNLARILGQRPACAKEAEEGCDCCHPHHLTDRGFPELR